MRSKIVKECFLTRSMFAKIYVHCIFAGKSLLFLMEHIFIRFLSIISVTVYEVFQSPRGGCNMAMVPLSIAIAPSQIICIPQMPNSNRG